MFNGDIYYILLILFLFLTVLDAENPKKSLFDDVISTRKLKRKPPPINNEHNTQCHSRRRTCLNHFDKSHSSLFDNINTRQHERTSLFDGHVKLSSSLKKAKTPSGKKSFKNYSGRRSEVNDHYPSPQSKRKKSSGSLFDKYIPSSSSLGEVEMLKEQENKIDRKIDVLRKEKETLQNLPSQIFEKALQKSYDDRERKSSQKSLQLLAESAKKIKSLFTQNFGKKRTPTTKNSGNRRFDAFKDENSINLNKRTLSDEDLEALAELLNKGTEQRKVDRFSDENFIPFVEEVKSSRLQDLLLAMKIMQTIDDAKSHSFNEIKKDKEIELLLAKSLFKRSIDSLHDLNYSQRNTLDSLVRAMHGNLDEHEREQTAESISRIFIVSAEDDSLENSQDNYGYRDSHYKYMRTTRPPKPVGPPSPFITSIPPTIVNTPSPPLPTVIGPPSPPTPSPVGPPSPPIPSPVGSPSPPAPLPVRPPRPPSPGPVGPPSPPRDEAFQSDDFFVTDLRSPSESDEIIYLAPDENDFTPNNVFSPPLPLSNSGSVENSDSSDQSFWIPMISNSPTVSSEKLQLSNPTDSSGTKSKSSLDESYGGSSQVSDEDGNINYNYHYHYFTYPLAPEETSQERRDSSQRFLPLPQNAASDTISSFLQSENSRETSVKSPKMIHSQTPMNERDFNGKFSKQKTRGNYHSSLERASTELNIPSPPSPPVRNPSSLNSFAATQANPPSLYRLPPANPRPRTTYGAPPSDPPLQMSYGPPPANPPTQTYGAPPAPPAPPRNPRLSSYSAPPSPPRSPHSQSSYATLPRQPSVPFQPSYNLPPASPPRQSYGSPPANPPVSYNAPPADPPQMSYGVPQSPRDPIEPPVRTRVVFLRPEKAKGKGKKGKGFFSAFSVLFGGNSDAGLRDSQLRDLNSDFRLRRESLRDEFWRTRDMLYREQREAFELERLKLEIKAQEKQREEMKKGLFRNMLRDGIGGNIRDMFYRGAMALGAMSLVPLSTMVLGRKKRSLEDYEFNMYNNLDKYPIGNIYSLDFLKDEENSKSSKYHEDHYLKNDVDPEKDTYNEDVTNNELNNSFNNSIGYDVRVNLIRT